MAESSNLDGIVVEPPSTPQVIERGMEDIDMDPLYKAISDNNWPAAEAFINRHHVDFNVEYWSSKGRTPLHVAAGFGHEGIVQGLVRLVDEEYLEIHDALGKTPLIVAAEVSGVIPVAECLINKNKKALEISAKHDGEDLLPVQLAIVVGHKEMGRHLYKSTPPHLFTENHDRASSFLTLCLTNGVLDIALDLLKKCKELLFAKVNIFLSTIEFIAIHLPDSSLDKSQLPFWKRWVYDYIKIPSTTTTTENLNADVQQHGENNIAHQGMKEIYQMKQQHAQAVEILNLICENVKSLNEDTKSVTQDALIAAAKIDKVEFLLQVTKANPEIILTGSFELFFDAVRYCRTAIFNLLRGYSFKHVVASIIDEDENEIKLLHLAASLAPSSYRNQAAESMVDPAVMNLWNKMNLLNSQKQPLDQT